MAEEQQFIVLSPEDAGLLRQALKNANGSAYYRKNIWAKDGEPGDEEKAGNSVIVLLIQISTILRSIDGHLAQLVKYK